MKQELIPILDNGHGIETKGKRSPVWADGSQLFEWEFNRDIVRRIASLLYAEGIKYRILVPEKNDVSLKERCARANAMNAEYEGKCFLLSIHANAGGGSGIEAYTSIGQTQADTIAEEILRQAVVYFPKAKIRSDYADGDADKEEGFYILKHTKCPAVLTENFFMDNEKDCKLLFSDDARQRIAIYHVECIKRIIK